MPMHQILLAALVSLSFWTQAAESKRCGSGEDMPEGSKVRIGVMHRQEVSTKLEGGPFFSTFVTPPD